MVTFSFSIRIIHSREFGMSYGAFQEMPRCSGFNEHVFMKSFHGDGGKITEMWKEGFSRGIGTYRRQTWNLSTDPVNLGYLPTFKALFSSIWV
jgi:hypothetical protein